MPATMPTQQQQSPTLGSLAAQWYNLAENGFWPSLTRNQTIPTHLAARAPHQTPAEVGLGLVKAASALLAQTVVRDLAVDTARQHFTLWTNSLSTHGAVHALGGGETVWWLDGGGYLGGVVALVDALTLGQRSAAADEVRRRWAELLAQVSAALGRTPPYGTAELAVAARHGAATAAMMAVTDSLYFYVKARSDGSAGFPPLALDGGPDPMPLPSSGNAAAALRRWLYEPAGSAAASAPAADAIGSLTPQQAVSVLRRAILRGANALLVGPTGVGKSVAARQAASEVGAHIVLVKGRPNLDDRDLYGRPQPLANGSFAFVDGPLARAWRLAARQEQRVVLLVDELARFDPYYLGALVGAFDVVLGRELAHLADLSDAARAWGRQTPEATYYVLGLPNGEQLVAPTHYLCLLATTNLGGDHLQLGETFDAALLRRFALHLTIGRFDGATRQQVIVARGVPPAVAATLVRVEDYTAANVAPDGLLVRELNLGVLTAWADEAASLVRDAGLAWSDAVTAAAELCAVPFASPRDASGRLDAPAAASLREEVARALRDLLPAAPR
jgi:nitric oxide reductase NorQ protein